MKKKSISNSIIMKLVKNEAPKTYLKILFLIIRNIIMYYITCIVKDILCIIKYFVQNDFILYIIIFLKIKKH